MAEPPPLLTRAQLRETGLTDRQIDARLASGSLVVARRGVLHALTDSPLSDCAVDADPGGPSVPDRISRPEPAVPVEIQAALLASPSRDLVISHSTAARLLDFPRPLAGWPQPQFIATSGPTRRRSGVHITVAALSADDVIVLHGLALTSPSRTVADCLRTLPGRDALAIIDNALHRGLVSTESVAVVLREQAGWPGVAVARQVLALADPRRESPLESWSAWAFAHTDVPAPQWQVEIHQPDGTLVGRADCWWTDGVVGEADGRSKYSLGAAQRGGGENAMYDVLHAERQREQRMRDLGIEIVRWTAGDVLKENNARRLAQRIAGAISLAQDGSRFTNVITPKTLPSALGQASADPAGPV